MRRPVAGGFSKPGAEAEYHAQVARGFDALARGYDGAYPDNLSLARLREATAAALRGLARPGQWWLELGCGTGRDVVELAERGVHVVAADPSPGMLAQLEKRLAGKSLPGRVVALRAGTTDLESFLNRQEAPFDGAALLFGALNYDPEPGEIPSRLRKLLKPGAPVVAAVRNRVCVWEILYYLFRRPSPGMAFRRLRPGGAPTTLGPVTVPMFTYTPGELARLFRPWFSVESTEGLCVALPPYMQPGLGRRAPGLVRWLSRVEPWVASRPVLRGLGDHFLMVLRAG